MQKIGRCALVVAACLFSARIASADSVTATLNTVSPGEIVDVHLGGQDLGQGYAGSIDWTVQSSMGASAPTGSFGTYCDDLTQDIYIGSTYTYDITGMINTPDPAPPTFAGPGMGPVNAQDITNLYALEYDGIGSDNDKSAAFQIAIWEMEYETNSGTHDVTSGNFYVTGESSGVANLANQYVSDALGAGTLQFHNQILAMTSPSVQDQLFIGPPTLQGGPPTAPTPAAAIAGLPLLGLLGIARKIRRRAIV